MRTLAAFVVAVLMIAAAPALRLVYASDVVAEPGVGVVDTFAAGTHPPIRYAAAVTLRARIQ